MSWMSAYCRLTILVQISIKLLCNTHPPTHTRLHLQLTTMENHWQLTTTINSWQNGVKLIGIVVTTSFILDVTQFFRIPIYFNNINISFSITHQDKYIQLTTLDTYIQLTTLYTNIHLTTFYTYIHSLCSIGSRTSPPPSDAPVGLLIQGGDV